MDHLPRAIERLQGRNRRPEEAELAVVVVLEDRHLVLVGEREELAAAGVAHHRSRGALRRRCRVDELHPPRLEHAGQLRGLEPLLVDPDADKVRLARREGERGAEVSRLLHHHRVTGIDERVRRGVDSLLGSVHHGDVARLAFDAPRDQVADDLPAEREPAERVEVNGERGKAPGDRARECATHVVHGEGVGGDLTPTEIEADRRASLRQDHAARELEHPRPERKESRPGEAPPALGWVRGPRHAGTRRPCGNEGALADVGRERAVDDQRVVRLTHRRLAETEGRRELARRRELGAGSEPSRLDEPAEVGLELPEHRLGARAIGTEGKVEHSARTLDRANRTVKDQLAANAIDFPAGQSARGAQSVVIAPGVGAKRAFSSV